MTSASVLPDSDELEIELTTTELATDDVLADATAVLGDAEPTALEMPSLRIPDRADAPVSEITERFFKSIIAKVPVDRIEELHLFAPLRQAGVETGIAVIAARVLVPVASQAVAAQTVVPEAMALEAVAPQVVTVETPAPESIEHADTVMDTETATESTTDNVPSATDVAEVSDESPYAPETLHEIVVDAAMQSMAAVAETAAVVERHTVYTARYRLVQKGAERGKWEASVVDEADAPLITVEMVVRGVQRRAGEASETTRYTGPQIARALRLPAAP